MICATCFNCAPMLVVGNCVFSVVDLPSAWVSAVASLMLFAIMSLAACTSDTPVSVLRRLVTAFKRACEAAELLNPASCSDAPGASATGCVCKPVPSRVFPATERKAGNLDELIFCDAM